MATQQHRENIDTILTYILIKKLVTPIVRTDAYKLGLVNNAGKVLHEPSDPKERGALTLLDKVVFKLKRLLGAKLTNLSNFLYLQTISSNFYNKLMVKGDIRQRAEIKRIVKDVKGIKEKYDKSMDEIICALITEELQQGEE